MRTTSALALTIVVIVAGCNDTQLSEREELERKVRELESVNLRLKAEARQSEQSKQFQSYLERSQLIRESSDRDRQLYESQRRAEEAEIGQQRAELERQRLENEKFSREIGGL
jgi:hypothetical protein